MNVTKTKLLEATNVALDTYAAKKARFAAATAEHVERKHAEALAEALEAQKGLRDILSTAIKAKKPLTESDLKAVRPKSGRGSYGYLSDFSGPSEKPEMPRSFRDENGLLHQHPTGIPVSELQALKATLEAVTEEEISDGQLQRLGFKNLGWVFRAAVANQ